MNELIQHYWQQLSAMVVAVIWIVRIEARTMANSRDAERRDQAVRHELATMEARLKEQRAEDLARRERRDEAMDRRLDDIASDIKTLLQRTAHGDRPGD